MVSTSLRRHDPDQVPGVEAFKPPLSRFASAPPGTYELIANTSSPICQISVGWNFYYMALFIWKTDFFLELTIPAKALQ